jgi:hypothetical protein
LMNGNVPGHTGHSPNRGQSASLAMNMSGMEMPADEMSPTPPGPGWITTVNWIAALGFAAIAVYWLFRYFAKRQTNPVPYAAQPAHVERLYHATTAAGTALMFAVML